MYVCNVPHAIEQVRVNEMGPLVSSMPTQAFALNTPRKTDPTGAMPEPFKYLTFHEKWVSFRVEYLIVRMNEWTSGRGIEDVGKKVLNLSCSLLILTNCCLPCSLSCAAPCVQSFGKFMITFCASPLFNLSFIHMNLSFIQHQRIDTTNLKLLTWSCLLFNVHLHLHLVLMTSLLPIYVVTLLQELKDRNFPVLAWLT